MKYLQKCWLNCLKTATIPAKRIKNLDDSILKLNAIDFFKATIQSENNTETSTTGNTAIFEEINYNDEKYGEHSGDGNTITEKLIYIDDNVNQNEPDETYSISERQTGNNDNLISLKPITSPVKKDVDFSFQSKSAQYIYEVIPNELNHIQNYDKARTQLKKNNSDKF